MLKRLRAWGIRGVLSWIGRSWHDYRIRAALVRNYRTHRSTPPVRGITIVGPMTGSFSLSKTLRDFTFALRDIGVPVQTFDTLGNETLRGDDCKGILTPRSEFDINRYDHIVEMVKSPLPGKIAANRRSRIVFWEIEAGLLDVYPFLSGRDTVVAMSDFNAEYFRRELPSTTPVRKILYPLPPIRQAFASREETRKKYGFKADDFIVFYNFDLLAFARKNPDGVVRAFAEAFRNDLSAKLLFKVNNAKAFPERFESLRRLAADLSVADRLTMVTDYVALDEIYAMTNACDVYCSLHRAEGFGLGIAEAMSLGKPVVVTDWSATTEFCKPDNSHPVPFKMVKIEPGEYFAPLGEWADPDVSFAAGALRRLKDDVELRSVMGANARAFIRNYFSTCEFSRSMNRFLEG